MENDGVGDRNDGWSRQSTCRQAGMQSRIETGSLSHRCIKLLGSASLKEAGRLIAMRRLPTFIDNAASTPAVSPRPGPTTDCAESEY